MIWQEHHKRNARISFSLAILLFLLGVGVSGYELWVKHQDLLSACLSGAQFWLMSFILLFIGVRYQEKAAIKKDARESGPIDFIFHEREIMVKQLGGLDLCYRYFTVEGELLAEFREERNNVNKLLDFLLDLAPFLKRTFFITDAAGAKRLILKQKAGINAPVDVFLPTGEKIARYRSGMIKLRLSVEDEQGRQIAEVAAENLAQTFRLRSSAGHLLAEFFNRGIPAKNQDYFSMSDDLVRFHGDWTTNERLYLQIVGFPALVKMMFRK